MEIRQLEYFLRVASEGSITRAAESLNMTQPPLSMSIARLEKELGQQLFAREPRGIRLTEAGEYLASQAERILGELFRLREDMRHGAVITGGLIKLAVAPALSWFLLPQLLQPFAADNPNIEFALEDYPPATVIEQVTSGSADIGIFPSPSYQQIRDSYASSLKVTYIGELHLSLALPPRYAGAPERVSIADLQDETWFIPRRSLRVRGLPELFDSVWEQAGLTPPLVSRITTLQTAIPLVRAGLGISLLPRGVERLGMQDIVLRESVERIPPLQAVAISSTQRPVTSASTKFLDWLQPYAAQD